MIYRNLFILYILFVKICIINSEKVTLTFKMFAYSDDEGIFHRKLLNEFNNNYAIVNNLNTYVTLDSLTPSKETVLIKDFGANIISTLERKDDKVDIFYYYSAYTKKIGKHLEDLKDYLPDEIKRYDETIINNACTSDNKIVGLPYYIFGYGLLSNNDYLTKYNKQIPKTWDELMETARYICKKEKEDKNVDFKPLKIPLKDTSSGSSVIYSFINSFRESNNSTYPRIKSKTTKDALKMLKDIKDEVGKDIETQPNESFYFPNNTLFMVNLVSPMGPNIVGSALPGKKEGVSGTVMISHNLGINKYISKKKKEKAIEFLKFVASKEIQRKYVAKERLMSGITELYDDNEICNFIFCDVVKNSRPLSILNNDVNLFGDDNYHPKYHQYMLDYIYNGESLENTLKKVEDITKIYTFSLKTNDSVIGLIIYIIFQVFFTVIALSIILVFINKLEYRFKFLSKNLWVITTIGSLILLSSIITLYDDVNSAKCHLRTTLINVGFVISICPSLHKLITNFPVKNKISSLFKTYKYISIIVIILFTIGLNGIFSTTTFKINDNMNVDKHFYKCEIKSIFGNIFYIIIQIYNFSIIMITLALIFMEWNLNETYLDVRYLASALFMDTLSLVLLIIFDRIRIKSYVIYNVLLAANILVFSVSNHVFIYLVRILPMFRPDSEYEDPRKILEKLSRSSIKDSKKSTNGSSSNNKPSSYNKGPGGFYSNLANSPYNNMGTSFYNNGSSSESNHMRIPSSSSQSHKRTQSSSSQGHKRTQSSSSQGHKRTQSSSSQGHSSHHMRNPSYGKPTIPSLLFSTPPTPSILYSNPSTAITSAYTNSSGNGYNIPKSNSYSGYNDSRKIGIIRKIMSYHNQTEPSYN